MNVIAVSNQKGGCGKTTTAINLAASLASLGRRTLLIDLDPQAHATFGLGFRGEPQRLSMYNVLTEQEGKRQSFLESVIVSVSACFDLAPSHVLLSTIEQEFTTKDESIQRLRELLSSLSFPYDYVVIDCPPSLGFLTFNALRAAETVIVPIELSSFSLMGVGKLLSMIELLKVKLQHTPRVFALPTMIDMRTRFSRRMMDEIRGAFGEHVLNSAIRQTISIRESQAAGRPVVSLDPKSKGAIDYLVLAQEIANKLPSAAASQIEAPPAVTPADRLKDFSFRAMGAREVHVVGDFNNWRVSTNSLLWQKEEGVWQKKVHLGPGRYRYKFVVDGRWTTDPRNQEIEPNPYGGVDSVLEVD